MPSYRRKRKSNGQFAKKSHGTKRATHHHRRRRRHSSDGFGGFGQLSLHIPRGLGSDSLEYLKIRNQAAAQIVDMKKKLALHHLEQREKKLVNAYKEHKQHINDQRVLLGKLGGMFGGLVGNPSSSSMDVDDDASLL